MWIWLFLALALAALASLIVRVTLAVRGPKAARSRHVRWAIASGVGMLALAAAGSLFRRRSEATWDAAFDDFWDEPPAPGGDVGGMQTALIA